MRTIRTPSIYATCQWYEHLLFLVALGTGVSLLAYPSCRLDWQPLLCDNVGSSKEMRVKLDLPFEPGIFFHELIKVCHELIDSFSHVHMSHGRPYRICLRKSGRFILIRAERRLKLISRETGFVRGSQTIDGNIRIFRSVLYWQQVITHSLVCELVNQWRDNIH